MKIVCKTNIDKWKFTKWPSNFVEIPRIGDTVRGTGPDDFRPELCVVRVTHTEECVQGFDEYSNSIKTTEALIEIELH